ncbi:3-keto-disaccharide hydrolase [Segetibacter aerophilus]|uniref:3-keto-alpha-glucoside-1,2-lyase/3-keto-2-hydroxy-glucal hydratase domain-containing protein n=1 Tax=Segetibacter aerophilus TaxID=670293 RepID=A0A512BGA1_9BACT|nr:DUF1080 domain-containing protein [Segetibacter aerophilus]GEO10905.1 hypothetical protein SAE01_34010 [Segetibacter aerophilus]
MKSAFLILSVILLLTQASAQNTSNKMQDNTLSTQEKNEGWKLLFDGKTTSGWHSYGYNAVGNAWNILDGCLHLDVANRKSWPANESKDILTNDEYDNFHLKVDWKLAKKGNSGIIFYVHEDKSKYANTYETGPEMQVLDNAGHADAKIPKHRAGDLYDLISSSSEPVKPAEEWNHAEIMCKDGKLEFFLNGVSIVTTTMWDDNWKKMVANSKFKSMPDFGTFKKGKIALQEHGEEVWFKNIKIRKL